MENLTLTSLGIPRVLNAATTYTRIGGSRMAPEVLAAMVQGASDFVEIEQLHKIAGERIAKLTKNEAAYITPGCAAAIVLSVLAIMDLDKNNEDGNKKEFIVDRTHMVDYVKSIEFAGGVIKEIGSEGSRAEAELIDAIDEKTAAIFFVPGLNRPPGALSIERTVEIAKQHNVPVIVDAAAQLPPVSNLWHFTRDAGADVVLFSGGKALRGPQTSGLILGKVEIINAAAKFAAPNTTKARSLKVGKEEIFAILKAVEIYVNADHEEQARVWNAICDKWVIDFAGVKGFKTSKMALNEAGQPLPRIKIEVDQEVFGMSARELALKLWESEPRIAVDHRNDDQEIFLTPELLNAAEIAIVTARVIELARN
jgi:L-seryl-tRNA(Ser) seleniumtransferase